MTEIVPLNRILDSLRALSPLQPHTTVNQPARLPESMYKHTIGNMTEGETGFCTPWAMSVTKEGFCYIRTDHEIRSMRAPQGTFKMKVGRSSLGFEVAVPKGYRYTRTDIMDQEEKYTPVVRVYEATWE